MTDLDKCLANINSLVTRITDSIPNILSVIPALDERLKGDKENLSTQVNNLITELSNLRGPLSSSKSDDEETKALIRECFLLMKRWNSLLSRLIYYISYYPYPNKEKTKENLRELGQHIFTFLGEINEMDIIIGSERIQILPGFEFQRRQNVNNLTQQVLNVQANGRGQWQRNGVSSRPKFYRRGRLRLL
ncbi:hypothetical protein Aperf_G00000089037 [Anoplocephala perfoliata]